MNKGERFEIDIIDLNREGDGFGRAEGLAVFVPGTVPGDRAEVECMESKKNFARGRITRLLAPSEDRVEPFCPYAETCGGCNLQMMSYDAQLALKEKWVTDALVRIGGLENPEVHEIIAMEEPFRYRNKAQFPVGRTTGDEKKKQACRIGFYKHKSAEVVNCNICMIQTEPAERVAEAVRRWVKATKIPIYDPATGTGVLRHVIVRTAFGTGEVMVILVAADRRIPDTELLLKDITKMLDALSEDINKAVREAAEKPDSPYAKPLLPGEEEEDYGFYLESLILNVNKKKGREVMGHDCITLAGQPTIKDYLFGLQFEISPLSFYQVNPIQTERLYSIAAQYADLSGGETVLDLYCGVGTIGLVLSGRAGRVIGIESVKAAVLDANRNAVINGIVNAEFRCGKAEEELPKLLAEGIVPDVVILDPPRAGCDPALLEAVLAAAPARVVYVSCDPATLARDIKILCAGGYKFIEAQPVDMFPHTGHVEAIILMTRSGSGEKK